MLYYEFKKILVKPGTKIAILVLAVTLVITCFFAIREVYYVNENGDNEYGVAAIHKVREAKKEWSGLLTEEVIAKVIAENNRLNATKEGQSDEMRDSNIVFGWKQGFHDIRWMLMSAFCEFQTSDYYRPDSLVPEDAENFYKNRILNLREWLAREDLQYKFSEEERQFFIERYEALKTPWEYDYADGFKTVAAYSSTIIMVMMLVLCFVGGGIFSGEFHYKADSVFYSSYHGRGKAVAAKIGAGFLFATIVYFATYFLYSAIVFGVYGTDGADLLIQTNHGAWKSFYSLTNIQQYVLTLFAGYLGTMFFLLLTMLVSARTKSTAFAVLIPFIILFIPSFVNASPSELVGDILGLMPDRLLDINQMVSIFYTYSIGGKVRGALHVLPVLYLPLTLILFPAIYVVYRKMEIK